MKILVGVVLICFFANVHGQGEQHKERVNVTVYYETLCPFAKKFIVTQLYPALQGNISEYVNLELIPYGKTTGEIAEKATKLNEFTIINAALMNCIFPQIWGEIKESVFKWLTIHCHLHLNARTSDDPENVHFDCHHGPNECYGNIIQTCSKDLTNYGNDTDGLGFNKDHLEFVRCLMKDLESTSPREDVTKAVDRCAKRTIVSSERLNACANNTYGIQKYIHYGQLTEHFQNPLGNVPTIVYNGVFNKQISDKSEINFMEVLCSKIKNPKPQECKQVPNNASTALEVPKFVMSFILALIFKTYKM